MRPRTLRGLGAAFLIVFLATVLAVGLAIYGATHAALDREVDRRLAGTAATIVPDEAHTDVPTVIRRIETLERQRESRDVGFMLLTVPAGGWPER